MKTTAARRSTSRPICRRESTTIDITANTRDNMLPTIQAVEAIDTRRGGLDGLDDK